MTPILDALSHLEDLKQFTLEQLQTLAKELRLRIIDVVSQTGGHLASNLGVVELTLALHRVFRSPQDVLIFDVGHQCYPHKLLTGRRALFSSLRQTGGLSGFTDPKESPHDHFYAGHAGNALSLALGIAKDRDLREINQMILPILGDAALTCGLALEALNNIPPSLKKFLIILNDNAMSISKNVGAIPQILNSSFNNFVEKSLKESVVKGALNLEAIDCFSRPSLFFKQFGLSYVGPIDGHDLEQLLCIFERLKSAEEPTVVHVLTIKGQGMENAMKDPTPYHGVAPFNRLTGKFYLNNRKSPSFPHIFGNHLLKMARTDPTIVAITPAMPAGSQLDSFMKELPSRCIDVGIAEGHSLTYAGGMARRGTLKVVTCIYSSFLQRAFDNLYHDICIQGSPVILAVDRAGLAAGDGVTAHGIYDLSFLSAMPGLVIVQPRNGQLLKELLESAFEWQKPVAIRYPNLPTEEGKGPIQKRTFGKGEVLVEGKEVILLPLGHFSAIALQAQVLLQEKGIQAGVIDPIFIKPLDEALLRKYLIDAQMVITLEEHTLNGGLGSIINSFILREEMSHLCVKNFGIPDTLIGHGSYGSLLEKYGLTPNHIVESVLKHLQPSPLIS